MNKLEELFKQYDEFIPPQKFEKLVNSAHKILIQDLEKQHRKLILQIIDSKDSIMNEYAEESFKCGFYVAFKLLSEINNYHDIRLELELSKSLKFLSEEDKLD